MSETDSYTDSVGKDLSITRHRHITYSVSFCDASFENLESPLINGSREDLIDPDAFEDDQEAIRNSELCCSSSLPASSSIFGKCSSRYVL